MKQERAGQCEAPTIALALGLCYPCGMEDNLRIARGVQNAFAQHGSLDLLAIFVGFAWIHHGERFGGHAQSHGGILELARVKLDRAGKILRCHKVLVAKRFEKTFLIHVNFERAVSRVKGVRRLRGCGSRAREQQGRQADPANDSHFQFPANRQNRPGKNRGLCPMAARYSGLPMSTASSADTRLDNTQQYARGITTAVIHAV